MLLWITLLGVTSAASSLGQGVVSFNNLIAGAPVTISTAAGSFNPNDGPPGAFAGSSYSVSLLFVNGTVTSQAAFDGLSPIWVRDAIFLGSTGTGPGHGINGDGSGFFDGGSARLTGQTDFNVTIQIRAWYNGGGAYTSYGQALAAGHNVGLSNLLPMYVPPPPGPTINLDGLQLFTVGIPEPSSISLILLGLLSLTIFRRQRNI